jgi:hypothetical protein
MYSIILKLWDTSALQYRNSDISFPSRYVPVSPLGSPPALLEVSHSPPTQLGQGPIRVRPHISCLEVMNIRRAVLYLKRDVSQMKRRVQNCDSYINIPSSLTYR